MPMKIVKYSSGQLATAMSILALFGATSSVYAQQESEAASSGFEEEVVVTGFRQSLQNALNAKRNASNVVDAIAAEDIGKSADQNIAEALQRVTGISISRQDGEGTRITVRGTSADLNQVTLNGVTLTSSGESQGVNFSEFSSDILSSIEVIKTPSADHDEGSLGGTVRLKGFKPLEVKKDRRSLEVQGRTNTLARGKDIDNLAGGDHKISLAFSEKLWDDRFGISFVAAQETSTGRTDRWEAPFWRALSSVNFPNGVTNIKTGEEINVYDFDGDGVDDPLVGRQPQQVRYRYDLNNRDRDSYSATFQFLPTDRTDIQLDLTYNEQRLTRDSNFVANTPFPSNNLPENLWWSPETYDVVRNIRVAGNARNPGVVRIHRDVNATKQSTEVAALSIEHIEGDFTFTLSGGRSQSKSKDDYFIRTRFGAIDGRSNQGPGLRGSESGFICDDKRTEFCYLHARASVAGGPLVSWFDNPELFLLNTLETRDRGTNDVSDSVFFDVDWDLQAGPLASLEAGVKWSSRENNNRNSEFSYNVGDLELQDAPRDLVLSRFSTGQSTPSDWGEGLGFRRDEVTNGWTQIDVFGVRDYALTGGLDRGTIERDANDRDSYIVQQDVSAGYIKGNFEFFDWITGDIGVRYVKTDVDISGSSGINYFNTPYLTGDNITYFGSEAAAIAFLGGETLSTEPGNIRLPEDPEDFAAEGSHSYTNVLPSLNLNFLLTNELILRFAASKTIARPRINDLQPGFEINEQPFQSYSNGRVGEPKLNPYKSTNLDLSLEWYFSQDSLLSVALFNKDFTDFAERSRKLYHWRDVRDQYYENGVIRPAADQSYIPTANEILLDYRNAVNNVQPDCMPSRETNLQAPRGDRGCDIVNIVQPRNGKGGYVRGMELTFQHNFTYLPSFLGDTGVSTNYTYADSRADEESEDDGAGNSRVVFPESPFQDTSKHTYNATLFWERDGHLVRLAYNSRSDYLTSRSVQEGNASWVEGFDTLDLSAAVKVNKYLSINFQAINLTDTVTREYMTSILDDSGIPLEPAALGDQPTHRTSQLENSGTTYRIGARMTF